MSIGIAGVASSLPSRVVSSEEIAEQHGFDPNFISTKLGIHARHFLSEEESVSGLAADATSALFAKTGADPTDVGILIVVTQTPDQCLPHVAAAVQDSTGISRSAAAYDMGLGCSGYVIGLSAIISQMLHENIDLGVLVTVDAYSRIVDPQDRNTAPLFGDAATATLLSRDWLYRPGRSSFGTDGSRRTSLIARGTGTAHESRSPLAMDGKAIFDFAMKQVPDDVVHCLTINNESVDTIDKFLFHQANAFMVKALGRRVGVPQERLVLDMADVGNTTSSSIPICLERLISGDDPLPKKVLISGFGVGLSWASTVLTLRESKV